MRMVKVRILPPQPTLRGIAVVEISPKRYPLCSVGLFAAGGEARAVRISPFKEKRRVPRVSSATGPTWDDAAWRNPRRARKRSSLRSSRAKRGCCWWCGLSLLRWAGPRQASLSSLHPWIQRWCSPSSGDCPPPAPNEIRRRSRKSTSSPCPAQLARCRVR